MRFLSIFSGGGPFGRAAITDAIIDWMDNTGWVDGHSIAPRGAYSGYGLAGTNARRRAVLRINCFLKAASAIVLKGSARSDIL